MTGYTLEPGEEENLAPEDGDGAVWWLLVESGDVRISTTRSYLDDGILIQRDYVARVAQPPGEELNAKAVGSSTAELELNQLGDSSPSPNLQVSLQPRRTLEVSGEVSSDVTDRQGRNLGKTRLMDSSNTLIDSSNPFPVDASSGGTVPVEQQTPVSLEGETGEQVTPMDLNDWNGLHSETTSANNRVGVANNQRAATETAVAYDSSGAATLEIYVSTPTGAEYLYHTESIGSASQDVLRFTTAFPQVEAVMDANVNSLTVVTRGT